MSETNIDVTATAKSKTFRMLSEWDIRAIVGRALDGDVRQMYRKGDSDEFHIINGRYAVVVKMEEDGDGGETAVVITQMHTHPDYHGERTYIRADSLHDRAGNS